MSKPRPLDRSPKHSASLEKAVEVFQTEGGVLRMADAIKQGIHRVTLYRMVDQGLLERMSRGLYRLRDTPPLESPDLVAVAKRVPQGVICLISALAFHDLTLQIPHAVDIAVPRNAQPPRLDYPPVRAFRFSAAAFSAGIEVHAIGGASVRVYCREKTLADCFKYRNKIGMDTVLEALKMYKEKHRFESEILLRYAEICRVAKVMRPYLEAML
jgi:predicted transcriptional regulator of viral defense system